MKKYLFIFILFAVVGVTFAKGQSPFTFEARNKKFLKVRFKLINFTPVIPVHINNSDTLYFIIDTGLGTTLITKLYEKDSCILHYSKTKKLKGLGVGEDLETIQSFSNSLKIGKLKLNQIPVNVLLHDIFNLSGIYGTKINGIIGYSLFQHLIVEINYQNSFIKFHNPEYYRYKRRKRHTQLPLTFFNKKPYIQTHIVRRDRVKVPVKLLVDSGASLAFWLATSSSKQIELPEKTFYSLIGQGLNGNIYGEIGRVNELFLGKYSFSNIVTAFPDSLSIKWMLQNETRNGSIGGEVLNKFNVIIDYPNQKLTLTSNARFKKKFYYNLSGLDIRKPYLNLPLYKVRLVSQNSPAHNAGIQKDDIIIEVNDIPMEAISLNKITRLLTNIKRPKVKLKIQRENQILEKYIYLKSRI